METKSYEHHFFHGVRPHRTHFGAEFERLNSLERLIVATAEMEQSVNHARIMDLTDAHPADVSVALQNLVKGGFLIATGVRRGKTYSPADNFSSSDADKQQENEDKTEDKNEDKADKYAKITKIIENFPKLTIPQLADKMQIKVSRMRSIIVRLEKERGLRHIGSRKAGHWEFKK